MLSYSLKNSMKRVVSLHPCAITLASFRPFSSSSPGNILLEEPCDNTGVLTLTLNRPKQRNALSYELLNTLDRAFDNLIQGRYKDYRCVIVAANGPVFSSGHDLKELLNIRKGDSELKMKDVFELCSNVMQKVQDIPQPVIACVNGMATAAGCQLVATCDLAVVSPESSFATPGVKIGLFCSTPAVALSRVIGRKAALDMLYTGRVVSADEAKLLGLVSTISNEPHVIAAELARDIANASGIALSRGKEAFYEQLECNELSQAYNSASLAMIHGMETNDAEEGITAFLEKRTPHWKHY